MPSSPASALVVAAVVVVATGCGDLFSTSTGPVPTFNATVATDSGPQPYVPSVGSEFLRFRGNVTTSTRCQEMKTELDRYSRSDGVIDLVLKIEGVTPCPDQQETLWNYLITLNGLDPGDYTLTVEHQFQDGEGTSGIVFEGGITVGS